MALEYRHIPRDGGPPEDAVTVDQHWYLTEDKDRVVPENDPAARWLWATPGMKVPRGDAERLGAVATDESPATAGEPEDEGGVKEQAPPPNKQRGKPTDKSVPKSGTKSASDDIDALRVEAEDAGVTVDKRWGVDRLRQEIAAKKGEG